MFIGGGHRVDELTRIVHARGLDATFRFIPYQDRILLKYSLAVPDVHWISLKPAVEGMIVPSKFYGIAAAGRPIIAITSADGEIARLVREYECGLIVEPGQAKALAQAILTLSADPSSVTAWARVRVPCWMNTSHAGRLISIGATSLIASDSPLQCSNGENPLPAQHVGPTVSKSGLLVREAFGKR